MTEEPAAHGTDIGAALAEAAAQMARQGAAAAILVLAATLDERIQRALREAGAPTLLVTAGARDEAPALPGAEVLLTPVAPLSRLGQVKIALYLALAKGALRKGDRVAALTVLSGSGRIDTLMVIEVGSEEELLIETEVAADLPPDTPFEVFERVLTIAAELGSEGREGKPVGALFVLGDSDKVLALSRPLIGISEQPVGRASRPP